MLEENFHKKITFPNWSRSSSRRLFGLASSVTFDGFPSFIDKFIESKGDRPAILPVTRVEIRLFIFARARKAAFDETFLMILTSLLD